jgi:hypothetical protein
MAPAGFAGGPPNSSRFLELADIAMGLKKPEPKKRKRAATGAHDVASKTEPVGSKNSSAPAEVDEL